MSGNVDLTQELAAAEARRQAAAQAEEQARASQRGELVGDLLLDIQTTANDDALDHDAKMSRLQAAIAGINGRGAVAPVSSPAAPPAAAAGVPFDYASLPEETRRIIDMVAAEPSRFTVEEFGAVKDKSFNRLRKNHLAAQAGDESDSSSGEQPATKKASAPAPAKKAASSDSKTGEAGKSGSAWDRIKQAAKDAAQNAKQ